MRAGIVSGWGRVVLVVAVVALVAVGLEPGRVVLVSVAGVGGGKTARRAGRRCWRAGLGGLRQVAGARVAVVSSGGLTPSGVLLLRTDT